MQLNPALDLFPLLAALLAALSCALLGNFLVLRRLSLMGDAISHAVLPGLVIAFLLTGGRDSTPMLIGAAAAGALTVVLVELVKKLGRVEPGAAMGVVFTALFALGVLLIETRAARQVDLDADCILFGQLETMVWYEAPLSFGELTPGSVLDALPRQVAVLAATLLVAAVFVLAMFKELRLAAFDPALSTSQGFHAGVMHYLLMVLVALATVASFEAVGSILVIAMLICPAAAARLLTDRLDTQIIVSLLVGAAAAVGGYLSATGVPAAFGKDAVSAAGSITVFGGLLVVSAALFGPRHGLIARMIARRAVRAATHTDDLLAALFRAAEAGYAALPVATLTAALPLVPVQRMVRRARLRGLVDTRGGSVRLTRTGHARAALLIQRHRLWETYLVDRVGVAADHVHETAEQLEHLATSPPRGPQTDPHGKQIPGGEAVPGAAEKAD